MPSKKRKLQSGKDEAQGEIKENEKSTATALLSEARNTSEKPEQAIATSLLVGLFARDITIKFTWYGTIDSVF